MHDYKYLLNRENISDDKSGRKKKIKFALFMISGVVFLVIISIIFVEIKKRKITFFKIKNIEIIGAENSPIDEIKKILNDYKLKPMSKINFIKLSQKLRKVKWIDDVIIMKRYPSTLIVKVIEKKPISILETDKKFYLIDEDGNVIDEYKNRFYNLNFVIFVAKDLNDYRKNLKKYVPQIYETLKKNGFIQEVSDIKYKNGELEMILSEPRIRIKIQPENFEKEIYKIKILKKIENLINEKKITQADLNYSDRIYLTSTRR